MINVADDANRGPTFGWDFNGAIHAVHPARRGSLNEVGQWNTIEITANGTMIRVVVNDQIVTDTDIRNLRAWVTATGLHNKSGNINFTAHRGETDVRNIRIKELP